MKVETTTKSWIELRQELCPGIKESQPQEMPLSAYKGKYWNPGYWGIKVQGKNGKVLIDATDWAKPSTLVFDHAGEQSKYIAQMRQQFEGAEDPINGEFRLADDKAVKIGCIWRKW